MRNLSRLCLSLSGTALYLLLGLAGASFFSDRGLGGDQDIIEPPDSVSTLATARVSGNPRRYDHVLGALGAPIAPRLGDLGSTSYRVLVAQDNEETSGWPRSGEVALAMETAFSALGFERGAGADSLARAWKKGSRGDRRVSFAREDSSNSSVVAEFWASQEVQG